ncbi:hypothetical protein CTI12_AA263490 [Artemisia annua]|uniref:Kinetochore protein Nuf2 N-terminal domain-containing protein n=1 Tax=Artemisia annua TaxID=35608 RepID=A0A2U1NIB4_ARTAN|nr:hypothetical protein CTI12_AA263490 [Artemisia annua]
MSRFEYPRLPLKEIIGVLADTGIATVTEANLTKPNSEFVTDLITRILVHINCLQEDHGLVEFADLEQLDNPDMHVDSVKMMNLYHKIKEVIAALKCPGQFNLKDIVKPEADRTQLFLSAILNFCIHREYKMNMLQPIVSEFEVLDDQGRELDERISQLNDEISELNEAREREMPFVQEIETKIKEMQQEITALNNQQHSLKITIRNRREASMEMDQKVEARVWNNKQWEVAVAAADFYHNHLKMEPRADQERKHSSIRKRRMCRMGNLAKGLKPADKSLPNRNFCLLLLNPMINKLHYSYSYSLTFSLHQVNLYIRLSLVKVYSSCMISSYFYVAEVCLWLYKLLKKIAVCVQNCFNRLIRLQHFPISLKTPVKVKRYQLLNRDVYNLNIQWTLEERKIAQVEAKDAERAAMQSFHEQTATDEVYTKARKKMTKHLSQMQTLQEQVNEAKKVEKDVKVLKTKNSDDTVSDKSLEAKLYEKQGRVDQLEELLKQLEKEKDLKCEEASKELNNVRAQVEYNRSGLEERERNAEALVSEGAAIKKNIIVVKDSATAKQQILLAKEDEIAKEFFEYSKSMGHLLSRIEAGTNDF